MSVSFRRDLIPQLRDAKTEYERQLHRALVEWRREWEEFLRRTDGGSTGSPLTVEDEGVEIDTDVTTMDFTGSGVTVTDTGTGSVEVNIPGGGGGSIRVEDEGSTVVAAATGLNFAGSGVVVTDAGSNEALVTIAGGSGDPTVQAQYVTMATHADLTSERVLTAGTGITITDGGANGNVTIAAANTGVGNPVIFGPVVRTVLADPLAAPTALGFALVQTGVASKVLAAGGSSIYSGIPGNLFQPVTGTNSAASQHTTSAHWYMGDAAGRGGFYYIGRFGFNASIKPGMRFFVGMDASNNALAANVEQSTRVSCFGWGKDSTDTDIYVMHNDSAGTCTKVATGFGNPTGEVVYEFLIVCSPNGSTIACTLTNIETAVTFSNTISTDLPSQSTALRTHWQMNTGTYSGAQPNGLLLNYWTVLSNY